LTRRRRGNRGRVLIQRTIDEQFDAMVIHPHTSRDPAPLIERLGPYASAESATTSGERRLRSLRRKRTSRSR